MLGDFRSGRSKTGAKAALNESAHDGVIPRTGVATVLPFFLALLLATLSWGCGQNFKNTIDLRGYENLARTSPNAFMESSTSPVELYLYIDSDNDIFGKDAADQVENQGEVLATNLKAITKTIAADPKLASTFAIHYYLDRGKKLREGDLESSELFHFCGVAGKEEITSLGETDSRDPKYLKNLLSKSCYPNSKKHVIIWSHGAGYRTQKDFDYHPTDSDTPDTSPSFHISSLIQAIPDHFAESLLFDSCFMATLEIATLAESKAKTLVASQFELPNEGYQYTTLTTLFQTTTETIDFVREIRKVSEAKFRELGISAPIAILDLTKLKPIRDALATVWTTLEKVRKNNYAEFRRRIRRGKDGDLLFLGQATFGQSETIATDFLNKLRDALESQRGSLSFALPHSLAAKDDDMESIRTNQPTLYQEWVQRFPNWSEYDQNISHSLEGVSL